MVGLGTGQRRVAAGSEMPKMRLFVRSWPLPWLLLAIGALLLGGGMSAWLSALIGGILVGAIFSMVGLYLNYHLLRGHPTVPLLGLLGGLLWGAKVRLEHPNTAWLGVAFCMVIGLLAGCLVQSVISRLRGGQKRAGEENPEGALAAAGWRSLGLHQITSAGARILAMRGEARPTRELEHGGDTDQYLEFSPDSSTLACWIPGQVELFSVESGASLGRLENRAFCGFAAEGRELLALRENVVERYALPSLDLLASEPLESGATDWTLWAGNLVICNRTGFCVTADSPEETIAFPYRMRVLMSKRMLALPMMFQLLLKSLDGPILWESDDVRSEVTGVGFSVDGRRLAFSTMGGSVILADVASSGKVTHQCLADGEIRCLAVSSDGLVAAGCADRSSKAWLFRMKDGEPIHVLEGGGDVWGVAFSSDKRWVATGHQNGKVQLWARPGLPRVQWIDAGA